MIIAANWKMHKTREETLEFLKEFVSRSGEIREGIQAVICPPFTFLYEAGEKQAEGNFRLGAQNMHWEKEGAFTGEVSPIMLEDAGVRYVVLGHSERRHVMGETDQVINRKMKVLADYNLAPIFCVGETEQERDEGRTGEVLKRQVRQGLQEVDLNVLQKMVIAYEPVWAIGTGRAAYPEDAREAAETIRRTLDEFDSDLGDKTNILYGGSVKEGNIAGFTTLPQIQGALVGGASLKPDSFIGLIKAAQEAG